MLAVNLPLLTMLRVVGGCVAGSLVRAAYFLLTKQLDLAAAHAFSVAGLFGHPVRLWQGPAAPGRVAQRRATPRSRTFIPPARTLVPARGEDRGADVERTAAGLGRHAPGGL